MRAVEGGPQRGLGLSHSHKGLAATVDRRQTMEQRELLLPAWQVAQTAKLGKPPRPPTGIAAVHLNPIIHTRPAMARRSLQ